MGRRRLEPIVAEYVMRNPSAQFYGFELSEDVDASPGAIYPLLTRWMQRGWVTDAWETIEESGPHPPRRFYRLTSSGIRGLQKVLAGTPARSAALRPVVEGRWWR